MYFVACSEKIIDCPVCNQAAELVTGADLYPHRDDLRSLKFYRCPQHLDYYVGCHKDSKEPLGVLANKEHRAWKVRCHSIFDPLWKSKRFTRKKLYNKLSREMQIPNSKTHFGMFTMDELQQAYKIIAQWDL